MALCPTCGHALPVERFGLVAYDGAVGVYRDGVRLALTPAPTRILARLVRLGGMVARHDLMDGACEPDASPKVLDVHIFNIRRELLRHRVPATIRNHYGVGYELLPSKSSKASPPTQG